MNKYDRANLAKLANRLTELLEEIETVKGEVEMVAESEGEKFDNMAEGLQGSDQGQAIEEARDSLTNIVDGIESAMDELRIQRDDLTSMS